MWVAGIAGALDKWWVSNYRAHERRLRTPCCWANEISTGIFSTAIGDLVYTTAFKLVRTCHALYAVGKIRRHDVGGGRHRSWGIGTCNEIMQKQPRFVKQFRVGRWQRCWWNCWSCTARYCRTTRRQWTWADIQYNYNTILHYYNKLSQLHSLQVLYLSYRI